MEKKMILQHSASTIYQECGMVQFAMLPIKREKCTFYIFRNGKNLVSLQQDEILDMENIPNGKPLDVPKEDLDRCVTRLRRLYYVTSVLSVLLMALGAAAILVTSPQYPYPINVGGGCFFGFMGLVKSGSGLWMCEEIYRMFRKGDVSNSYIRFSWRGIQWILRWMNLISCIIAVVFSGILATRACIDTIRDNGNDVISREACGPRPRTSLSFSILVCVFSAVLIIMKLMFHLVMQNPVIKDFRRRTEDLECQKGKVQIKTVTYKCAKTSTEQTLP